MEQNAKTVAGHTIFEHIHGVGVTSVSRLGALAGWQIDFPGQSISVELEPERYP